MVSLPPVPTMRPSYGWTASSMELGVCSWDVPSPGSRSLKPGWAEGPLGWQWVRGADHSSSQPDPSLCVSGGAVVEAQSLVQQLQECGRLLDALGS